MLAYTAFYSFKLSFRGRTQTGVSVGIIEVTLINDTFFYKEQRRQETWGLASEDSNLHHGFRHNALPIIDCEVTLAYGIFIFLSAGMLASLHVL